MKHMNAAVPVWLYSLPTRPWCICICVCVHVLFSKRNHVFHLYIIFLRPIHLFISLLRPKKEMMNAVQQRISKHKNFIRSLKNERAMTITTFEMKRILVFFVLFFLDFPVLLCVGFVFSWNFTAIIVNKAASSKAHAYTKHSLQYSHFSYIEFWINYYYFWKNSVRFYSYQSRTVLTIRRVLLIVSLKMEYDL